MATEESASEGFPVMPGNCVQASHTGLATIAPDSDTVPGSDTDPDSGLTSSPEQNRLAAVHEDAWVEIWRRRTLTASLRAFVSTECDAFSWCSFDFQNFSTSFSSTWGQC
jgi:hypothetical protein